MLRIRRAVSGTMTNDFHHPRVSGLFFWSPRCLGTTNCGRQLIDIVIDHGTDETPSPWANSILYHKGTSRPNP
jgi:hypothetical protein